MPIRKRTALVDQRISRSRLSEETDPQQLLEQQHALARPTSSSMSNRGSLLGLGSPVPEETARREDKIVSPPVNKEEPIPLPSEKGKERERPESPPVAAPVQLPPPISKGAIDEDDRPPVFAEPRSGAATPTFRDDDITSPTASILDSMDPSTEDQPVTGSTAGLKRNTSAEVSRLRGPRGARGPRPAPGRVVSGIGIPAAIPEPDAEPKPPATETERGGGVGVAGDYAPRRGKGATSAGAVSTVCYK